MNFTKQELDQLTDRYFLSNVYEASKKPLVALDKESMIEENVFACCARYANLFRYTRDANNTLELLDWLHARFMMDPRSVSSLETPQKLKKVEEGYNKLMIMSVFALSMVQIFDQTKQSSNYKEIQQVIKNINDWNRFLKYFHGTLQYSLRSNCGSLPDTEALLQNEPQPKSMTMQSKHCFVSYLMDRAQELNYKRIGDFCCKAIQTKKHEIVIQRDKLQETTLKYKGYKYTENAFKEALLSSNREIRITLVEEGYDINSYEPVMEIEKFVYENISQFENYEQWINALDGNNISSAINYMKNAVDYRFIDITSKRSRNLISFCNGVYEQDKMIFHEFYDLSRLSNNKVSCNYIDRFFNVAGMEEARAAWNYAKQTQTPQTTIPHYNWRNLATPLFESILITQKIPSKAIEQIYALLGRLFYEVGTDNFELALMILGLPGSGKTTISEIIQSVYHTNDVGIANASSEKVFGMSSFYNKFLVICPEMDDLIASFPQDKLQSAISGEKLQVPIKNKTAVDVRWSSPILFVGNQPPKFKDLGQMKRRFVPIICNEYVHEESRDPQLKKKIREGELALFIRKCNEAYLEMLNNVKGSIWVYLHAYFKNASIKFQKEINPLYRFLTDKRFIYKDSKAKCKFSDFEIEYKRYCEKMGIVKPPELTTNFTKPAFSDCGLVVVTSDGETGGDEDESNEKEIDDNEAEFNSFEFSEKYIRGIGLRSEKRVQKKVDNPPQKKRREENAETQSSHSTNKRRQVEKRATNSRTAEAQEESNMIEEEMPDE